MGSHSEVLSILMHTLVGIILLMGLTDATALSNLDSSVKIPKTGNTSIPYTNMGEDFDWEKTIHAYESEYALPIMTVIGFLPKIYEIYKKIDALLNPEAPKQTLEDVVLKVTQEISEVKNQLKAIEKKLTQQEIYVFHNIERVVNGGLNDLKFKSTINLESRAVELFDQLSTFVNGMLGQSTVIPDLLATLKSLNECGSRSMYTTMERFVTLLNVGAIGISYYSKTINNKDKFDGDFRIQTLSDQKDAILKRLQEVMKQCASLETTTVNEHISKVLYLMPSSSTVDVTRALYERFDDIYYPLGLSWVFYAAWDFHPIEYGQYPATHIQVESARMISWDGPIGWVKTGDWSVYWTGQPRRNSPVGPIKAINTAAVNAVVNDMATWHPRWRHAVNLQEKLKAYNPQVSPDSRYPVFWLYVVNPPSSATFGQPLNQQLNALSYRFTTKWQFFHRAIPSFWFHRGVSVDIVVL